MSDLREVLRQHADAVEDRRHHERVSAVHGRVAAVRRRRVVAGAVAVLLVAGGIAGGLAWPHDHAVAPADRPSHLVGHAVPKTTMSWGATYTYSRGYVGTGPLTVTLPKSDQDVLVRVASAKDDGQLVVTDRGSAWVLPAGTFGTFRRIDGAAGKVTVDAHGDTGDIALAVYALSERASGYTRDGITYPDRVADRPLVGAFIGQPGEVRGSTRLQFGWTGTPTLEIRPFCVGAPKGSRVAVDLGDGPVESGCSAGPAPHDAGHAGSSVTYRVPSGAASAAVRLVDRLGHPISASSHARIGAGIYGPIDEADDAGLATTMDQDGHTWRLDRTTTFTTDLGQWRDVPVDATQPVLIAYGTDGGPNSSRIEARITGQDPAQSSGGGIAYSVLASGDSHDGVKIRSHGLPEGNTMLVARYVLDD